MMGWEWLEPWARIIVPSLLHFLWQGAFAALIVVVLMRVLRRSAPTLRYAALLVMFGVMTASPLITAVLLSGRVPLALPVSAVLQPTSPDADSQWQRQWPTDEAVSPWMAWQPSLLLMWLAGVGLCSLRLTGGLIWYAWLTRRLEPIPVELITAVKRLSQRLGLRTSIRVMVSHDVREPMAMRFFRPLIVLPASWLLDASPLMVEAVLAHELAHIRRHDLWVNLLQRVVETWLFFHPAVWWLSRLIRRERELCCDGLAVAVTGRAVEYAQALEAVARFRLAWSSPAMAAGMGGDRMALLDRVRRVLGLETAPETGWWPVGLAGVLLAAACGSSVFFASSTVQGDDDKAKATGAELEAVEKEIDNLIEAEQERRSPRREEENRPRPPREDGRREPVRGDNRDGDAPRPPRAENRPDGGPREGEPRPTPRRESDRRPEDLAPRTGERAPHDPFGRPRGPQPEGDVMHELLMTIRELRQEVQMLREEVRASRRPGEGPRGEGPGPGRGLPDGRRPSEDDFRPREGRGPDADGRRPPLGRERPRDGEPRPEGAPRGERREGGPRPEERVDEAPPRRPEGERKPESPSRPGF